MLENLILCLAGETLGKMLIPEKLGSPLDLKVPQSLENSGGNVGHFQPLNCDLSTILENAK